MCCLAIFIFIEIEKLWLRYIYNIGIVALTCFITYKAKIFDIKKEKKEEDKIELKEILAPKKTPQQKIIYVEDIS